MRPTIDLPRIFESQDPKLAYGFVTLARMFSAMDEPLIAALKNEPTPGVISRSQYASQSIARFLRRSGIEEIHSEIDETQRLDILVTDCWLRVLVCQLHIGQTPQSTLPSDFSSKNCVLDASGGLLRIISSASPKCLESHGIGMVRHVMR